MSNHPNLIIVSGSIGGKMTVGITGRLAHSVTSLQRYVDTAEGVTKTESHYNANYDGGGLVVTGELISEQDTEQQLRIRVRNRCRDWIHRYTGYMSNMGPHSSYVDLIEDYRRPTFTD